MRHFLILTFFSAFSILYSPLISQVWTQKTNFIGGAGAGGGFSTATNGYVFRTDNTLWEYEPATDTWTQIANLPSATRSSVATFVIGQKAYICFGYISGGWSNEIWEFDINLNSWTQKNNFPGLARTGAVGLSINGKGYAGLGNNTSYLVDFWEYNNVTDTWTQRDSFPGAGRDYVSSFCIGSKAYVGLGLGTTSYQDFFEYNSITDSWSQKAAFPLARLYASGFSIGNYGYFCAGEGPAYTFNNDLWRYDPLSDSWSQGTSFGGQGRKNAFTFSINSCAYIGGGAQTYYDPPTITFNDIWAYCLLTDINEFQNKVSTTFLPNPFYTQTVLQTDYPLKNATLTIDNPFGQTVAQIKNLSGQTIIFNRDNLPSGLYFVQLTEENKTIAVEKLVITDK